MIYACIHLLFTLYLRPLHKVLFQLFQLFYKAHLLLSPLSPLHPCRAADNKPLTITMASQADPRTEADVKELDTAHDTVHDLDNSEDDDHVDTKFQPGVQDIEAVTIAWSMTWLIIAYILIWLTYFVQGLVSGVTGSLLPYVTSAFAEHSLTPTTGILSAVIGGVTNLSIAKVLDIFGRPQGYLLCIMLCVIGLIMSATCNNVEAYAASQVFYTVGINGIGYSLSVFVADTSSLRNRGLMQAFVSSPNLITCWLAGPISTAFLKGAGWRWAFGMFTILVPAVTLPLFGLFMLQFFKAKKLGLIRKRDGGRTPWQSIIHYCREFDAIGLLLISAGVAFFLLPFNLYTIQAKRWGSSLIICFLVFGIVLMVAFTIWEKFFAPVSFIPWSLLQDRTVLGACLLSFTLFISYSCWVSYQLCPASSERPEHYRRQLCHPDVHRWRRPDLPQCRWCHQLYWPLQTHRALLWCSYDHSWYGPADLLPPA